MKTLRVEAKRHGVRASVLCPGAIRTPILTGGQYGRVRYVNVNKALVEKLWERTRPMDPSIFARRALDDVLRNKVIIVHPKWWKALWYLERVSPALGIRLWERLVDRLRADLAAGGMHPEPRRKKQNGSAQDVVS